MKRGLRVSDRIRSRKQLLVAALVLLVTSVGIVLYQDTTNALPCSCNVFGAPTGQSEFTDGVPLELGVKIIPNANGYITGVRFYKQGSMGGVHTGRLWTSGGSSLSTAVFTAESASGWQEVTFSSPVAVTAGTTYVASVTMANNFYIATPNYFTSDVVNGPLTAPSAASSGGNGVYNTVAGTFPSIGSSSDANYWIDVAFFDTSVPTVTGNTPLNGATNVLPGETLTVTFDQNMDPSSLTASTIVVKDPLNNSVPGTVSYNDATKTASFVATSGYATNTVYTVTVEGGTGTVVKNAIDIALASDHTWSFTSNPVNECPCTLQDRVAPLGSASFDVPGEFELGTKVRASTNGYITALRFYKPITSTETTHTGNIWSSTGTNLATVSFTSETSYGWQEARLSTPLRVNKDQVYIVSYGTTTAVYQSTIGGLVSDLTGGYVTAYANNSAQNAAAGSGNSNGVFSTTVGAYPSTDTPSGNYYWIDVVFAVNPTPDYPLSVEVVQPTPNAYGVPRGQAVTAAFNRQLNGTTVTNSTFRLLDGNGVQVPGVTAYDSAKGEATITPSSNLTYGATYTAELSGSIADLAGTTLGAEYTWSFTVGSQLSSDPADGPGGPLLVITSSTNKYSTYYAEILRTEGLNYFDVKDISAVDASTLNNYQAAVMAEMTISQSQADMLSDWVHAGGNLVAMRPDDKLANLLGLADAGTTRSNQYVLINTSTAPGSGLVSETIQFKGTADNYDLNGATSVAAFYSDASTSTTNPAVTTHTVGSNGGTAAAFAYDLAKSVIALHQGNQAWAGQNRDGLVPIRTNDLFFGAMSGDVQPDWVDLNKFHIPQADEQQRLLANMLIEATKDKRPLPRFWYLPGEHKAAMVMAGDDHEMGVDVGSEKTMSDWLNESPTDCSLADWECIRASHYIYEPTPLTNASALRFYNLGFEVGIHVGTAVCADFDSYAALSAQYTSLLTSWRAKYSSIPNQVGHRYHCYAWSDWDSQARVELANGMRYDLNYVAHPSTWIGSRAPIMTGSGMNMRFTDDDGDMLDIRQGVTNFDNVSSTTTNINSLLDNATGASGYYGLFGTHYDMSDSYHNTLYASAKARNIPMISSKQALTWLDGRDSSTFSNFGGSNGMFTFDIAAAEGANKLRAMLPIQDAAGTLSTLKLAGTTVSYQTQTVKGMQYAVFNAKPGSYTATYSDYAPNTGGDSGGSSPSPSTTTTKKKTTVAQNNPSPAETPTEDADEVPTNTENNDNPDTAPSDAKTDTGTRAAYVWTAVIGIGLLILVSWLLFYLHRRHSARSS